MCVWKLKIRNGKIWWCFCLRNHPSFTMLSIAINFYCINSCDTGQLHPPASHWIQAVNFMGELRTSLQEFKCYYYLVSHCSNQKDKINQLSAQIQLYFECGLISLSYPFTFENHISFQDQINALQKLKLLSSPTVILHFCSQLNLEIIRDDDSLLQPL